VPRTITAPGLPRRRRSAGNAWLLRRGRNWPCGQADPSRRGLLFSERVPADVRDPHFPASTILARARTFSGVKVASPQLTKPGTMLTPKPCVRVFLLVYYCSIFSSLVRFARTIGIWWHFKLDFEGPLMAAPPRKPRLSAEQRRALEMLDLSQGGCSRPVWAAHGFTLAVLVSLVRDGLADMQAETLTAGGWTTEVVRIRITAAGRRALEG